ncbi:putative uncharacterized protein [Clostridium sp. CAG:594]|jgi:uncharacterized integral membrane protein|nr:putative uncharacterized protein [Clostridium sp. CAG:594]
MKKLYKKILTGAFILLFAFIFKIDNVSAASCRIGVSAPSSVVVGQSFKVTVTVAGSASIGSWEYTLSYDSSKVRLNSGTLHVVDYGNGSKSSSSYSYSFTALQSGSATFKPVNASVLDYASTNECLSSTGSASVSMKSQSEIEASYSRNNNLSSLSVEGADLSPSFNKNITEYQATLPVDTTKAKIIATAQDSKASITGAGEVDVVDGINKIEIIVTAEHGEKKKYVINLTVQELDPVKVKVDGKTYTVVRKKGQVENIPVGFTETTIKIGDQDVCAYQSEIAKILLVALKDNEGNIKLFIYDKNKNSYTSFMEAKGGEVNLLILNNEKIKTPLDFVKTSFKINDLKIEGYKYRYDKNDNYYLVYAKNLETGDEGFYLYDKKNSTFSRYYKELSDIKDMHTKYVFYVAAALALIFVLIIIFKLLGKFKSNDKKIEKYQRKIDKLKGKIKNEDSNYDYSIDDVDDRPVIKRVEEDEYVMPKKSRKEKLKELEEAKKRLDKNKPKYRRLSLEDDDEL